MLGVFAIIILLHVCFFVAERQQVGLVSDRVLYLQGRVDQLGHEVKTLVETIGALQRRMGRKSRRRVGSSGGPDHSGVDMQHAGVSMQRPSGEAIKFHAESEPAESESESRMKLYKTTSPYETEGGNRTAAPASPGAQARRTVPEFNRVTSSRKNAPSFNDRHAHDARVSTPLPWGKPITIFNDDGDMHDAGVSMLLPADAEVGPNDLNQSQPLSASRLQTMKDQAEAMSEKSHGLEAMGEESQKADLVTSEGCDGDAVEKNPGLVRRRWMRPRGRSPTIKPLQSSSAGQHRQEVTCASEAENEVGLTSENVLLVPGLSCQCKTGR
jgi:hypothetical protein